MLLIPKFPCYFSTSDCLEVETMNYYGWRNLVSFLYLITISLPFYTANRHVQREVVAHIPWKADKQTTNIKKKFNHFVDFVVFGNVKIVVIKENYYKDFLLLFCLFPYLYMCVSPNTCCRQKVCEQLRSAKIPISIIQHNSSVLSMSFHYLYFSQCLKRSCVRTYTPK